MIVLSVRCKAAHFFNQFTNHSSFVTSAAASREKQERTAAAGAPETSEDKNRHKQLPIRHRRIF